MDNLIADAVRPGNFYVGNGLELAWLPPRDEEIPWEIFRGRLLDSAQTRQTRRFLSWNIHQRADGGLSAEPILSVKWDQAARQIHVVRAILSYVHEPYDAGDNVILTRETTKWVRELVGTIDLSRQQPDIWPLVQAAILGHSRLPLHSYEAPLPAFTLGQFAPINAARTGDVLRSWQEVLQAGPLNHHILEIVLRAVRTDEVSAVAAALAPLFAERTRPSLVRTLRKLFQNVSLSPYTDFVANTLAVLRELERLGALATELRLDFLADMLILITRHLTAYDLVTFHHRGANYPDALLLDALLHDYLDMIETKPKLASGGRQPPDDATSRRRRRALRQACLLRRHYEGLAVPDAPTSPGENARVLPPPHTRVPEEQLTNVLKRKKQLYANDPLPAKLGPNARRVFAESVVDLLTDNEWQELGRAVFVDRPFGWDKPVGEPDLTPLLSHLTCSPAIARRRFKELLTLCRDLDPPLGAEDAQSLTEHFAGPLSVAGVPIADVAQPPRPVIALADAAKVSSDFIVVQTLRGPLENALRELAIEPSVAECLGIAPGDCGSLPTWFRVLARVSAENGASCLAVFDSQYQRR